MALQDDELTRRARRVPLAPPTVSPLAAAPPAARISPLAAEINQQVRRPGGISPVANQVNQQIINARPAAAAPVPQAPAPLTTPAYRTGAPLGQPQFQPTPTPVNPQYRASPVAAPSVAAPVAGAAEGTAAAAARAVPGSRALPALAVGLESLNVAGAARDRGVAGAVNETLGSAGRLGAAAVGARAGAALAPAQYKAAGSLAGGVAGYALGQRGVEAAQRNSPDGLIPAAGVAGQLSNATVPQVAAAATNPNAVSAGASLLGALVRNAAADGRRGNALRPAVTLVDPADPNSASLTPSTRIAAAPAVPAASLTDANSIPSAQAARPAVTLVDPTTAEAKAAQSVGTFQGRTITRAQANQLAGQLNGGTGSGLVNGNPTGAASALTAAPEISRPRLQRTGGAGSQGAVIGAPGSSTIEQIDKQIRDLGPLNMRSKRSLVDSLLGLRARVEDGTADRAQRGQIAAADLSARYDTAEFGGDVDMARIDASRQEGRRQRQQTVTGADGTVYTLDGTQASPVTVDGKPLKQQTKVDRDTTQQKLAADLLTQLLPPGATPEQITTATQQANQAAAQLASGDTGPAQARPANKAEFLKRAKEANPSASNADLEAYYARTYGGGT